MTLRARLTALYGGLLITTSLAALTALNIFLTYAPAAQVKAVPSKPMPPHRIVAEEQSTTFVDLSILTAAAALVLIAASVWAGWWLAGRTLRPLERITSAARRLSLTNLHERIGSTGPRDELTELADTFDAMLDRLESAVAAQSRFVANASHELRTPLAIQRAAIEIGLADPTPERIERFRADLLDANRRTQRLIDGLLVLARGEHGLEAEEVEPVRLDRIAEDVVAGHTGVTLAARPTTVSGDAVLLTQLVANLIDNAVRYNVPGGTTEVTVTPEDGLVVSNTGNEVPSERIPELFEPFRRMAPDRTLGGGGSGLGLSIVAAIARAHEMTVTARPNPGGGLTVSCTTS